MLVLIKALSIAFCASQSANRYGQDELALRHLSQRMRFPFLPTLVALSSPPHCMLSTWKMLGACNLTVSRPLQQGVNSCSTGSKQARATERLRKPSPALREPESASEPVDTPLVGPTSKSAAQNSQRCFMCGNEAGRMQSTSGGRPCVLCNSGSSSGMPSTAL